MVTREEGVGGWVRSVRGMEEVTAGDEPGVLHGIVESLDCDSPEFNITLG